MQLTLENVGILDASGYIKPFWVQLALIRVFKQRRSVFNHKPNLAIEDFSVLQIVQSLDILNELSLHNSFISDECWKKVIEAMNELFYNEGLNYICSKGFVRKETHKAFIFSKTT